MGDLDYKFLITVWFHLFFAVSQKLKVNYEIPLVIKLFILSF